MKKWFRFSIYKDKKEKELIIHWYWCVPHIPFENIEYAKTSKIHQLVFCGTDNLYWLFNKDYKGKYKFFSKTNNDHCKCGG